VARRSPRAARSERPVPPAAPALPDIEITGPLTHLVTGLEQTVAVSLDDVPVRMNAS